MPSTCHVSCTATSRTGTTTLTTPRVVVAEHRCRDPVRVRHAAAPRPSSRHLIATVDSAGLAARAKRPGHERIAVGQQHPDRRLGHPRQCHAADRAGDEHAPRRSGIDSRHRLDHVHLNDRVRLGAADLTWAFESGETGFAQRVDRGLGQRAPSLAVLSIGGQHVGDRVDEAEQILAVRRALSWERVRGVRHCGLTVTGPRARDLRSASQRRTHAAGT